jgi:hypothetical protein
MGHQRIGTLPATRKWKAVIALITGGASAAEVAAQTALAAEQSLEQASRNRALRHAFYLLTQIPLAARTTDFAKGLRELGLQVSDNPSLVEIGSAMLAAIDRVGSRARHVDDLSEIASKAAAESLMMVAGRSGESLFGASYAADDARAALRGLSTNRQFGVLARDFMSRLILSISSYFLSRVLPQHVGTRKRFQSVKDHHAFDEALNRHCRETSFIVEQYACDWFSKTNYEGGIDPQKAGGFLHVALGKVRAELEIRRAAAHA